MLKIHTNTVIPVSFFSFCFLSQVTWKHNTFKENLCQESFIKYTLKCIIMHDYRINRRRRL